jgi:hypothetical protein
MIDFRNLRVLRDLRGEKVFIHTYEALPGENLCAPKKITLQEGRGNRK